jgi:hypothetical protein
MSRFKALLVLSLVCLLGVGACSDATGPQKPGLCPISGGTDTCVTH